MAAVRFSDMTGVPTQVVHEGHTRGIRLEHPTLAKLYLFDLIDAERIVFFDPDAVVLRPWNVRAFESESALVAVHDRFVGDREHSLGVPRWRYFNAGVFIANRTSHAAMFRYARSLWSRSLERPSRRLPFFDQSALNAAAFQGGADIRWIPERYNWLNYGRRAESGVVVAHFTRGIDAAHRTLATLLGTVVEPGDVPHPRGAW